MKIFFFWILKKEEDYWDEYENNLELNFDKLSNNKSSQDESSYNEEKKVIVENKKKEDVYKSSRDNEGEVQVKIEERTFESE